MIYFDSWINLQVGELLFVFITNEDCWNYWTRPWSIWWSIDGPSICKEHGGASSIKVHGIFAVQTLHQISYLRHIEPIWPSISAIDSYKIEIVRIVHTNCTTGVACVKHWGSSKVLHICRDDLSPLYKDWPSSDTFLNLPMHSVVFICHWSREVIRVFKFVSVKVSTIRVYKFCLPFPSFS